MMPIFTPSPTGLDAILHRRPPQEEPLWERLLDRPYYTIALLLYAEAAKWRIPPQPLTTKPVSIVCISDTHGRSFPIPDGDVLIHAGDLTQTGSFDELEQALLWLAALPHPIKVIVAGNHDVLLDETKCAAGPKEAQRQKRLLLENKPGLIYLQDEATTVTCPSGRRLSIYGSPQSPKQGNWAFQYPRTYDIWKDSQVPKDVDILVTHCPPRGHLDLGFGCEHLLQELWRVKPRLHVCGHIHAAGGTKILAFDHIQRLYEQLTIQNNLWSLVSLIVAFVGEIFTRRRRSVEAKTILVNAAMVAGARDDLRRSAVTVVI